MHALTSTVIAVLIVALGVPAYADIKVKPKPWSPEVHIKVKKKLEDRKIVSKPTNPNGNGRGRQFTCSISTGPETDCDLGQFDRAPTAADPEDELTEGDILQAVREIGLPSLEVQVQPGEKTLVNIETIFYTEPQPFERSIDLLGFDIDLSATPVSYRWVHDDGTASTTSKPGRPYPAMDVTHRYRKPDDDVRPRVDVTYRVRYRVDGRGWQTIGQTLQASGPAVELDVREAAPVLTKP